MVKLTRIYTRTGDEGYTSLGDFTRTHKNDSRLIAFSGADETNSAIGVALAMGNLHGNVVEILERVQHELFDVGADLCTPIPEAQPASGRDVPRINEKSIARLERECDRFNADLPNLRSFVLPGGTPGAALLHVARASARRAERAAWVAVDEHGQAVNVTTAKYLNRLSDLLFILARHANLGHAEVLWDKAPTDAAEGSATD